MSLDQSLEELKRRLTLEPGNSHLRTQFEQSYFRVHRLHPYPAFHFDQAQFPAQFDRYFLYREMNDCLDYIRHRPVSSFFGKNRETGQTIQLKYFPGNQYRNQYSLFTELASHFQMITDFDNPNILSILEFDRIENRCFYIVRRCPEGLGLLSYLKTAPSLPWRLHSFFNIATACKDLQEAAVIHGSLRAENIVVGPDANAYLCFWDAEWEFLLRRESIDPALKVNEVAPHRHVATLAPEYVNDLECQSNSDIFQLGILLFEILTDELPQVIKNTTLIKLIKEILKGTPRSLSDTKRGALIPPKLCKALQGVCNKALATKPENRYQSVAELLEDYHQILQDHHEPRYLPPGS